jgi:hypothetical protein
MEIGFDDGVMYFLHMVHLVYSVYPHLFHLLLPHFQ